MPKVCENVWNKALQDELAKCTEDFLECFYSFSGGNKSIDNGYVYTSVETHKYLLDLVSSIGDVDMWDISPDCNGGAFAIYLGSDYTILTIETDSEENVKIDYIDENTEDTKVFSFEVPLIDKISSIRKIINEY